MSPRTMWSARSGLDSQHEAQHASEPRGMGRGQGEVAVSRHEGTCANYLYADGHVDTISADQIEEWCDAGTNFAIPQRMKCLHPILNRRSVTSDDLVAPVALAASNCFNNRK